MTSNCFICGESFPRAELSVHEKACLQSIQTTPVQYTRQNTDDMSDSLTFLPNSDSSVLSNHSSGSSSNEGNERKTHRCYICGIDVPIYLKSIHEKNCKKSWESGLLNSITTPAKLSNSRKDLSKDTSELKKAKTVANIVSCSSIKKSQSTSQIAKDSSLKFGNTRAETPTSLLKTRVGSLSLNKQKSHSTTNLFKSASEQKDFFLNHNLSTESLRLIYDNSDKKSSPQYVECFTCGKQYSTHSIDIHQKQCIKTRTVQVDAGVVPVYIKKSKSLADVRFKTNSNLASPSRSVKKTLVKDINERRLSAFDTNKRSLSTLDRVKCSVKSSSTSNLSRLITQNEKPNDLEASTSPTQVNSGFQECHICTQLYGSRSLPIHEKQCLKKFELARLEDEKGKKRIKANREFDIIPFGHSQEISDKPSLPITNGKRSSNISLGSGSYSGLDLEDTNDFKNKEDLNKSEPISKELKRTSLKLCVYCNLKFGQNSIFIHEKSCREKNKENRKNNGVVSHVPPESNITLKENDLISNNNGELETFTDVQT